MEVCELKKVRVREEFEFMKKVSVINIRVTISDKKFE